jgi:hypothetical protein
MNSYPPSRLYYINHPKIPRKGIVDRVVNASYNLLSQTEVVTSRCSWMMVVLPTNEQSVEINYLEPAIIGGKH